MKEVDLLRRKAEKLIKDDPDMLSLRSCWFCNASHEHLKNVKYVIRCFGCGRVFYKGVDVTIYEEGD